MDVSETLDEMGSPKFIVKSEKFKSAFEVIKKFGSGSFYMIKQTKGRVPDELSGVYTNHERALAALNTYCAKASVSATVRRDQNTKIREERKKKNASASQPDNSEHVQ